VARCRNDILKEYQAQKEFIFPPRPSLRLVRDTIAFLHRGDAALASDLDLRYHIREAGSTAAQELAFTVANGFAYVELAMRAGLPVDAFAPRLSFFFNAHVDFFEEIAKYRAARRIWPVGCATGTEPARAVVADALPHADGRGLAHRAQPEVNVVRTAIEALAGVLGGPRACTPIRWTRRWRFRRRKAARVALRTQQVIAHETRVTSVADPLGGSWYVKRFTEEMERRAEGVFAQIEELGDGSMLDARFAGRGGLVPG